MSSSCLFYITRRQNSSTNNFAKPTWLFFLPLVFLELLEETGYGKGNWKEYMVISANPSTHTNLTHCFLATDVEQIDTQHLEDTEALTVHLLSLEEVKELLENGQIMQSLHAAPLWKYMAEHKQI